MFTGIVQAVGQVAEVCRGAQGLRLRIATDGWAHRAQPGASIAVAGCCLTHAPHEGGEKEAGLVFDVVAETLSKTTLGRLQKGDRVNLEPALCAGDSFSGHFVLGHVDGTCRVVDVSGGDGDCVLKVEIPQAMRRWILPGGSIALDGVSLTVAGVEEGTLRVALIPTTLQCTTLGELKAEDQVNLEADMLAKAVVETVERMGEGLRGEG